MTVVTVALRLQPAGRTDWMFVAALVLRMTGLADLGERTAGQMGLRAGKARRSRLGLEGLMVDRIQARTVIMKRVGQSRWQARRPE